MPPRRSKPRPSASRPRARGARRRRSSSRRNATGSRLAAPPTSSCSRGRTISRGPGSTRSPPAPTTRARAPSWRSRPVPSSRRTASTCPHRLLEEVPMRKQMIQTVALLLIVVLGLGGAKFMQIRAAMAQGAAWQPPPEAVSTTVAHVEEWPSSLGAIGSVAAVQGVTVSADLPGIVERIEFESGRRVQAGDVLVRLDISQEREQLASAEAHRDLAHLDLDRSRQLLAKQVISQAEFDRAEAESKQADAAVREIQARIERKTIRAPFSGLLGLRQVDLGQYLNGGDAVVPLQSMDPVYINFALPQQDLAALRIGAAVRVLAENIDVGRAEGVITAMNSIVDEATRNVQVQATFRNPTGRLRPGMFVRVEASLGRGATVIGLPASAVNYAPD